MPRAPLPKTIRIPRRELGSHAPIRVRHFPERARPGRRPRAAYYKLTCGDCPKNVDIFYSAESLEINGVEGSVRNWRRILLPLLGINPKTGQIASAERELRRLRKKYRHLR